MTRKGCSTSSRFLALCLVILQITTGCSHLTKQDLSSSGDYKPSLVEHYSGDSLQAIEKFPRKENGGFVTSVEKLWLNLINKTPDMGDAIDVSADLSERTTLSVSKETRSYFYKESEDGYYPAEHEAILLHILSGYTFAAEGKRKEATIEARKAAFYLQNEYGSTAPFDDPALRLWLGSLWLYCGEWQHARVDFRVAASLSKTYSYLKDIADRDIPPKSVSLVLAGSGPQIYWTPALKTDVLAGMQKITFKTNYSRENFSHFTADGNRIGMVSAGIPTITWYDRHQERDHVIRKILQQSRYTVEATGAATLAATTKAVGTALAISIAATGVVGGLAALYYTISYLDEGAVYLAIVIAGAGVGVGKKVYNRSSESAQRIIDAGMSPVNFYRYVRFLPDFVHLTVNDEDITEVRIKTEAGRSFAPLYALDSPGDKTRVNVFYVPGGYYDPGKAVAPSNYVLKAKQSTEWIFADDTMNFEQAYKFCEKQSVLSGKNFRIPTKVELKLAISRSFGDPNLAERFDAAATVWTKAPYVDTFSSCQHFDAAANTELLDTPCKKKRTTLCGDFGR